MTITLRLAKGSELTYEELDNNFVDLDTRISTVESNAITENQTLTLIGSNLLISGGNSVNLSGLFTNTFVTSASFNDATGDLTLTRNDANTVTVNLDGRYITSETDSQTLSLAGTDLTISNGNTISLASLLDNTDEQTLSLAGTELSITGGNTVDLGSTFLTAETDTLASVTARGATTTDTVTLTGGAEIGSASSLTFITDQDPVSWDNGSITASSYSYIVNFPTNQSSSTAPLIIGWNDRPYLKPFLPTSIGGTEATQGAFKRSISIEGGDATETRVPGDVFLSFGRNTTQDTYGNIQIGNVGSGNIYIGRSSADDTAYDGTVYIGGTNSSTIIKGILNLDNATIDWNPIVSGVITNNGLPVGTEASGLFARSGQSLVLGYKDSGGTPIGLISLNEANAIQLQGDVSVASAATVDFQASTLDFSSAVISGLNFDDISSTPTTISGYGITDFDSSVDTHLNTGTATTGQILSWTGTDYDWIADSGIALSDLSVTVAAAGSANLTYDNTTGVFTYTPPDLSGYLTSYTETDPVVGAVTGIVKSDGAGNISAAIAGTDYLASYTETDPVVGAVTGIVKSDGAGNISAAVAGTDYLTTVAFGDLTSTPTTVSGYGITDFDSSVDTHLNTGTATSGQVLTWNGSDYIWNTVTAGSGGIELTDLSVTVAAAGSANLTYDNINGIFTYTPPDLSGYLTSYTETDPVVGAVTGIVKSDGAGNISAAIAGTDYLASYTETDPVVGAITGIVKADGAGNISAAIAGTDYVATETDPVVGAITGIVKADGAGNISAAVAGTDYVATETDPVVGAVTGIVKSDGAGNISAAVAGTDYLASYTETDPVVGAITGIVKSDGAGNISAAIAGTDYVATETDPVVGAVTGIVKSDGAGNISAAVAGTDYLTTVAFGDLTSTPTTISGYGITDFDSSVDTHLNTGTATTGEVLSWNGSDYDWVAQSGGGSNAITQGDSAVTVTDTGSDGNIEFKTDNTVRWNVTSAGHLIPNGNGLYDIGEPLNKVRDLYLSTSSLKFVDEANSEFPLSVANGNLVFNNIYVTGSSGVATFNITQDTAPSGIAFNNTGSKMYITGGNDDNVFEYDLATPFNVTTAVYNGVTLSTSDLPQTGGYLYLAGVDFNDTGTKMYVVDEGNQGVHTYNLSPAYDLSSATTANESFSFSSQDIYPDSIRFNTDGSKMFMIGEENGAVYEYNLSTNFDVSTATYSNNSIDLATLLSIGGFASSYGLCFNATGTIMLITETNVDERIYEIVLGTGFDLTTASYNGKFITTTDFNQDATNLQEVIFNNTGSKLYIVGRSSDDVTQIDLSTPYDISTGSSATLTDAALNTTTATANQILSWSGSDYVWVNETDPVVGAITGIVKADGAGNISAAVAGTDYLASYTETDPVVGAITGIVKSDGAGNISAAVAGTDYVATETDPVVGAITGIVKADGAGNISAAVAGTDYTLANQSLDTTSDVTFGSVTTDSLTVSGAGTSTIQSGNNIVLDATNRVLVSDTPFRLAQLTTAERDAISAPENGDMIYNTTETQLEAYQNGSWGPFSLSLTDLSVGAEATASGDGAIAYDNTTGVFTYTPPDLSGYLTGYTETDPVVGAVTGIVKADGAGSISAAVAGTDYTLANQSLDTTSNVTFNQLQVDSSITENNHTLTGTTVALDPANGTIQTHTLTGPTTYNDSISDGQSITLLIPATANTITWPTIKWQGGTEVQPDATNDTLIIIFKIGSTLYGSSGGVFS